MKILINYLIIIFMTLKSIDFFIVLNYSKKLILKYKFLKLKIFHYYLYFFFFLVEYHLFAFFYGKLYFALYILLIKLYYYIRYILLLTDIKYFITYRFHHIIIFNLYLSF